MRVLSERLMPPDAQQMVRYRIYQGQLCSSCKTEVLGIIGLSMLLTLLTALYELQEKYINSRELKIALSHCKRQCQFF